MVDELKLLCGNDIPFPEGRVTIHQPTLKQIGYISEKTFWSTCEILKFNKNSLPEQDKVNLLNKTNFNIILTMIKGKDSQSREAFINVHFLLTLLFPTYLIQLDEKTIRLKNPQNNQQIMGEINDNNFEKFKEILTQMFCLTTKQNKQYNPSGPLAKKIADKFAKDRKKRAQLAPKDEKVAILSRYMSILSVGLKLSLNQLKNYTVYQLFDEFNRFMLNNRYKSYIKYKIAGATDLPQDAPDWLKDIHNDEEIN